MKNLIVKVFLITLLFAATSFKNKMSTGYVNLEVSYMTVMGGQATVYNTDTNTYYYINAVDTQGFEEVPYGNYELVSAGTNSCNPPLIHSVTTSTGFNSFVIDSSNPSFTIYASCY